MKKNFLMMGLMAMMSGYESFGVTESGDYYGSKPEKKKDVDQLSKEEFAKIRHKAELEDIERKKADGLKAFEVNGQTVYALNMKNAIRKANKLKTV